MFGSVFVPRRGALNDGTDVVTEVILRMQGAPGRLRCSLSTLITRFRLPMVDARDAMHDLSLVSTCIEV